MDIENLRAVVKKSHSFSDISRKLYNNTYYGNRQTIKKYIELNNINIDHFRYDHNKIDSVGRFVFRKSLNEILINPSYYNVTNLKERLYEEGIKKRECELCGQGEKWREKHMSLILDHINGNNKDHRLVNLRIVCPNCNATLDTHCRGIKRKKVKIDKKEMIIKRSISQRNVDRPDYDKLIKDVNVLGYLGTGRKYGVSDNTIRKWIKFHNKYGELA